MTSLPMKYRGSRSSDRVTHHGINQGYGSSGATIASHEHSRVDLERAHHLIVTAQTLLTTVSARQEPLRCTQFLSIAAPLSCCTGWPAVSMCSRGLRPRRGRDRSDKRQQPVLATATPQIA